MLVRGCRHTIYSSHQICCQRSGAFLFSPSSSPQCHQQFGLTEPGVRSTTGLFCERNPAGDFKNGFKMLPFVLDRARQLRSLLKVPHLSLCKMFTATCKLFCLRLPAKTEDLFCLIHIEKGKKNKVAVRQKRL